MKRLFFSITFILLIMATSGISQAKVTGVCSNCHTMHSSQTAAPSEWTEKGWTAGTTIKCLLVGTCQGCHAQGGGASITADNIPQVYHTETGDDLAGGNFKYVKDINDNTGHNVSGIISADGTLDDVNPPGYDTSYDPASTKYNSVGNPGQVNCAGTFGCHGNRDETDPIVAVKGGHHGDDTCLKFGSINESNQGASVATSYRFLYKVKGGEYDEWQRAGLEASDRHNEYKGANLGGTRPISQSWSTVDTISEFCAECHGLFHEDIGSESPWLRHPTDEDIPESGEYAAYDTYNVLAPVARTSIPNLPDSSVTGNIDILMCLSCHRAHGSPNFKLMRWDYKSTTLADALSGCNVCHTSKD